MPCKGTKVRCEIQLHVLKNIKKILVYQRDRDQKLKNLVHCRGHNNWTRFASFFTQLFFVS